MSTMKTYNQAMRHVGGLMGVVVEVLDELPEEYLDEVLACMSAHQQLSDAVASSTLHTSHACKEALDIARRLNVVWSDYCDVIQGM